MRTLVDIVFPQEVDAGVRGVIDMAALDNHVPYERYEWDKWTDGQPHILTRGIDFSSSMAAFKASVHYAARVRGMKARTVRIRNEDGTEQMKVRFLPA